MPWIIIEAILCGTNPFSYRTRRWAEAPPQTRYKSKTSSSPCLSFFLLKKIAIFRRAGITCIRRDKTNLSWIKQTRDPLIKRQISLSKDFLPALLGWLSQHRVQKSWVKTQADTLWLSLLESQLWYRFSAQSVTWHPIDLPGSPNAEPRWSADAKSPK